MVDGANARPAKMNTVKSLAWYGCWDFSVLSSATILLQVGLVGVLTDRDDQVDGSTPGLTVSTKAQLVAVVNVVSTEGLLRES